MNYPRLNQHSLQRLCILLILSVLSLAAFMGSAETAQAQGGLLCPPPQPLIVGGAGVVLPGEPNILRDHPGTGTYSSVVGSLLAGEVFTVLDGPRCVDNYNWWQVYVPGKVGWTADGTGTQAWLAPSYSTCNPLLPTRLIPGSQARITPGLPNVIRAQPGAGSNLGTIPAGAVVSVLDGPACANIDQLWWRVNYNGTVGWTGELDGGNYWMEPYFSTPLPFPNCPLPPRLKVGATGIVTPGEANRLRTVAGVNASIVGSLPAGATFTVLAGPTCVDGYLWWQVTAGGITGWTAEGNNGIYWVLPVVCGNGMTAQVAPGMTARVTPGLANRIRSMPDAASGQVIGRIPAGETVTILANFTCDIQGRLWWLVDHKGTVGWTVEGDNGSYWLTEA